MLLGLDEAVFSLLESLDAKVVLLDKRRTLFRYLLVLVMLVRRPLLIRRRFLLLLRDIGGVNVVLRVVAGKSGRQTRPLPRKEVAPV